MRVSRLDLLFAEERSCKIEGSPLSLARSLPDRTLAPFKKQQLVNLCHTLTPGVVRLLYDLPDAVDS
jgi:hypothetical protein